MVSSTEREESIEAAATPFLLRTSTLMESTKKKIEEVTSSDKLKQCSELGEKKRRTDPLRERRTERWREGREEEV